MLALYILTRAIVSPPEDSITMAEGLLREVSYASYDGRSDATGVASRSDPADRSILISRNRSSGARRGSICTRRHTQAHCTHVLDRLGWNTRSDDMS
jgi:hypothetical protein